MTLKTTDRSPLLPRQKVPFLKLSLAAIPSAVITAMFAEEYRVLQSESSTAVLGTRIVSLATIPLVFALTQDP